MNNLANKPFYRMTFEDLGSFTSSHCQIKRSFTGDKDTFNEVLRLSYCLDHKTEEYGLEYAQSEMINGRYQDEC
jgi:hypothetical protein